MVIDTTMEPRQFDASVLHRVSGIVSSELSLDEMLGEVVGLTARVSGCDACLVYLVESETGEFVLPGVGRIVRSDRRARTADKPAARGAIKVPAKRVVTFRVAKAKDDATVPPEKK